jgi:predicted RNase H-like HicB family nuclease
MKNANIIFWQEGDWWIAKCLENSVASQGKTYEEAKKNIVEALELTYEDQEDIFADIKNPRLETVAFTLA